MNKTITKQFIHYVSFNMFAQIAYSCYTLADTFFVSFKLHADGLTALNLAFPIFCIMSGCGLLLGIGGGSKYAIAKSRNDQQSANQIYTHSLFLGLIVSILFVFLGLCFSKSLVTILGADQQVFSITHTYLKVLLLFAPAFLLNTILQCFIRNDGNPALSMKAMLLSSIANIILDYIFIFPCDMGILGAILATSIAPILSLIILSSHFINKKNGFHFIKTSVHIPLIKGVIASGIPSFLSEASAAIVMLLFNYIILKISGNLGVAAFSIITVVSLVCNAMYTGLSQGIQPLFSTYYGRKQTQTIKKLFTYSMTTMFILSIFFYILIITQAEHITAIFNNEHNILLQQYASEGLKLYFLACPFIGTNIVIATYFLSCEHPIPAQLIASLRSFFILIPTTCLLSYLFHLQGVWLAYPVCELLVSLIAMILYRKKTHAL